MRWLMLLALAVLAAGCGTSDDREQARATVERFYDAIRHDHGAQACDQLSSSTVSELESQSGQPCARAITRLDYSGGAVVRTQVFITNAKVDLRGGESAFLGRESAGWKISAVACKPAQGKPQSRPYECEVKS